MRQFFIFAFCLYSLSIQAHTIQIYTTVDWEGISLEQVNIEAIQDFRKKFPHIPMLQLLNPVYFLRGHTDSTELNNTIKSTFLPNDTQGLHVHAWKSLVEYCGIPYQHNYSFADSNENCNIGDCGYTVSLENAYSNADLSKLIACSSDVLVKNGFSKPRHFRAGGWQLGAKLSAALETNGFTWDSSHIDANILTTRWHEESGMIKMLRQLHPTSTPLDQPFAITTQLTEYPNNAGLADYTTSKQLVTMFKALIEQRKSVMVLGFHQETAVDYLHRLATAIPQIEAIAKENNVQIEWLSK
ncbi:MAG: hypothetical protein SFU55_10735 [Methylophilus sp.]|nr:hypothetical protein [Methylophilus sp.]